MRFGQFLPYTWIFVVEEPQYQGARPDLTAQYPDRPHSTLEEGCWCGENHSNADL